MPRDSITPSSSLGTHTHLVVYDFDDTIFPTSAFRTIEYSRDLLTSSQRQTLDRLDQRFAEMVRQSSAIRFVIVTNASESWVHRIMPYWMPRTYAYFGTVISILSAPDRGQDKYRLIYHVLMKGQCRGLRVLSVGDGPDEETATRRIREQCPRDLIRFWRASRRALPVTPFLRQLQRILTDTLAFIRRM